MERRCVNLCHERNQETIRNRRRRNSWKFVQLCERDFEREQENMTLMKETFDWECACVILLYYVCVCLCTFVLWECSQAQDAKCAKASNSWLGGASSINCGGRRNVLVERGPWPQCWPGPARPRRTKKRQGTEATSPWNRMKYMICVFHIL